MRAVRCIIGVAWSRVPFVARHLDVAGGELREVVTRAEEWGRLWESSVQ